MPAAKHPAITVTRMLPLAASLLSGTLLGRAAMLALVSQMAMDGGGR